MTQRGRGRAAQRPDIALNRPARQRDGLRSGHDGSGGVSEERNRLREEDRATPVPMDGSRASGYVPPARVRRRTLLSDDE